MKRLLTLVALATAICASGKSPTTPRIHKTSNEISVTSPTSTEPNEAHAPRVMLSAISYYEGICTLEGEILSETAGIIDYGFLLSPTCPTTNSVSPFYTRTPRRQATSSG